MCEDVCDCCINRCQSPIGILSYKETTRELSTPKLDQYVTYITWNVVGSKQRVYSLISVHIKRQYSYARHLKNCSISIFRWDIGPNRFLFGGHFSMLESLESHKATL